MKHTFKSDYGVFCCSHVFSKERPVSLVIRDSDGYWQFLCGSDEDNFEDGTNCHHIGVGHLISSDPSLDQMANLAPATGAERDDVTGSWEFFDLDD